MGGSKIGKGIITFSRNTEWSKLRVREKLNQIIRFFTDGSGKDMKLDVTIKPNTMNTLIEKLQTQYWDLTFFENDLAENELLELRYELEQKIKSLKKLKELEEAILMH